MLSNHFKIAIRNILKQRTYTALNVIGLAIGISSALIITLHIREELSYDKSYESYDHIYRLHRDGWAKSSPPMAQALKDAMPEIQTVGRFSFHGTRVVTTDRNNPGEVTGYFADSTILDVFHFRIIEGDRKQALAAVNTVVVTQSMAKRYFGDENPIGKNLKFDNRTEYPVVAVIEDLPANTHLKFDYLISMSSLMKELPDSWANSRGWMGMYTYVRLNPESNFDKVSARLPEFISKFYEGSPTRDEEVRLGAIRLMPLADIHLHSNLENEMNANSSITYVYIFIAVATLILIVASANFMSLFTTQAIRRVKEVGMRKIMGAKSPQLIGQFFTEVVLLMVMAMLLAVIFYQVALPFYNSLSGKALGMWEIFEGNNVVVIGFILAGVILISGLYPAYFITRFKSGSFMKESKLPNSMSAFVRSGLVVFQFTVSVSLIAAAVLVQQQMNMLRNKELGFDKEQVVNVKLYGYLWYKAFSESDVFKNEFLKNPEILAVGRTGNLPGDRLSLEEVVLEGSTNGEEETPTLRVLRIDENYIDAMGIQVIAGRNFSKSFNDSASFIVNEAAVKFYNLDHALDVRITNRTRNVTGKIVGVIKDYHFASLHQEIEPLILEYRPDWANYLTLKIQAGKSRKAISYIGNTVQALAPHSFFSYNFLDDRLDNLYKSEDNMGKVFQFFSMLAIAIACLGLLGLSAYTIESRTKEIGIRKALGASVSGIMTLVSSSFLRLILVGLLIGTPLTWYTMNQWLARFAYKIEVEWWVFALTGVIVLLVAFIAVGFQIVKAALANPVHSLRYE